MFWTYRVAEWANWEQSMKFTNEEDDQARERRDKSGMLRRSIYRSVADPNEIMLVAEFSTRAGAEALLQDPEGMRRWHERTGLDLFPPVLITERLDDLGWTR
jgi:quinol monooxygenase YgiN